MRFIFIQLLLSLALAAGCPTSGGKPAAPPPAVASLGKVVLVRSDLGLGDGELVRDADAALAGLAGQGRIEYSPVGELPSPLVVGAKGNIGLPKPPPSGPGEMEQTAAEALLAGAPPGDLLVLSAASLVAPALSRIAAGELSTRAVLLLDDDGYVKPAAAPAVPVYVISYAVKDIAFLCGVAAAQSARNGMFVVMAQAGDPTAQDFLDGAYAGARFHTSGAQAAVITLPVDPATGQVTPEIFARARRQVYDQMGSYFTPDHYIVALGRSTASVMQALAGEPDNAYVVGAYGDMRNVRPARVVGCALKQPGAVLTGIFSRLEQLAGLAQLAPDGYLRCGLDDNALAFTDFELYGRYNPDSVDIEKAVTETERLIRADELDYEY